MEKQLAILFFADVYAIFASDNLTFGLPAEPSIAASEVQSSFCDLDPSA